MTTVIAAARSGNLEEKEVDLVIAASRSLKLGLLAAQAAEASDTDLISGHLHGGIRARREAGITQLGLRC